MNEQQAHSGVAPVRKAAAWGAVISIMLGVFALATAEFLPPSVLTPIASDLGISVGLAGQTVTATAALALVAIWGLVFGTVPVAWTTWVTRSVSDEAESGGGLLVAAVQVAIAAGAGIGGIVVTLGGVASVFMVGGAVLVAAALFIALAVKTGTRAQQPNGLVREEAIAMLAGEIGSAVDFTTIRGNRVAHRNVNNSGEICHDH